MLESVTFAHSTALTDSTYRSPTLFAER